MGLVVRFSDALLWIVSPGWSKGRRNAMEEDVGRVWGEFWHGEGSTSCRGLTATAASRSPPPQKQPALARAAALPARPSCSASGGLLPARWRLLTWATGIPARLTRCRSATHTGISSSRRTSTGRHIVTIARTCSGGLSARDTFVRVSTLGRRGPSDPAHCRHLIMVSHQVSGPVSVPLSFVFLSFAVVSYPTNLYLLSIIFKKGPFKFHYQIEKYPKSLFSWFVLFHVNDKLNLQLPFAKSSFDFQPHLCSISYIHFISSLCVVSWVKWKPSLEKLDCTNCLNWPVDLCRSPCILSNILRVNIYDA